MYVLKVHSNISFLKNNLSEIDKILTTFSTPDQIFPKNLCSNQTHF